MPSPELSTPPKPTLLVHGNTYHCPTMWCLFQGTEAQRPWCWPRTSTPSSLAAVNLLYGTFLTPGAGAEQQHQWYKPIGLASKNSCFKDASKFSWGLQWNAEPPNPNSFQGKPMCVCFMHHSFFLLRLHKPPTCCLYRFCHPLQRMVASIAI